MVRYWFYVFMICDNISMSLGWLWSFHVSMAIARQMLMRYSKQNKLNSERRVLRRTIHMSLQTSNKSLFLNTKLHKTLFDEALFYLKSSPEDLLRFLRIYLILPPHSLILVFFLVWIWKESYVADRNLALDTFLPIRYLRAIRACNCGNFILFHFAKEEGDFIKCWESQLSEMKERICAHNFC